MTEHKTNSRIERELSEQGFEINTHRFPYTYHHDYVRGSNFSRSDIARQLKILSMNDNQYDYSACYGAILYLIEKQPHLVNNVTIELLKFIKSKSIYSKTEQCGQNEMKKIYENVR